MTDRATLLDSRRLTGPSRLLDRPGVVIDVQLPAATADALINAWRAGAEAILAAVGWPNEELATIRWAGGASLGHTAPLDALYSATDLNEWAWSHAIAEVEGGEVEPLSLAAPRLADRVDAERSPALVMLAAAARTHQVQLLVDNHLATVGTGNGSHTYELTALPTAEAIDWSHVRDVPAALITGSNGKTTTVRLLAAMLRADALPVGYSCTDGVVVAGESLASGDYSGPEGARMLLRDTRVGVAVLETARGGLLRRGLAVTHADVAVVTNIAADHFGEYGVQVLGDLTAAKLVVAKALDASGWLVLSADDAELVRVGPGMAPTIAWFSLDPGNAVVQRAAAAGLPAAYLDNGRIVLQRGADIVDLGAAADAPLTLNGTARYNILNALAAALAAWRLGCTPDAMRSALTTFGRKNADNPGRTNTFAIGGVQILLDYAHNPHGIDALVEVAAALPATRRAIVLGQAGDRDDAAIRGLARSAWALKPDAVFLKEMLSLLRGRVAGEIPALMRDELEQLGMAPDTIAKAPTEIEAVQQALDWSRAGDLLVLTIHNDRAGVLALLEGLANDGWRPAA